MERTKIERPYLTYVEAQQYTGLHRVTLWRAAFRRGQLKASGYGRAVRFHVADLDEFVRGDRETTGGGGS